MEGDAADEGKPQGRWEGAKSIGTQVLYNFLLFCAYWFGANRFDWDGDGDFDPDDVQAFLEDSGVAARNFTRHAPPGGAGAALVGGNASKDAKETVDEGTEDVGDEAEPAETDDADAEGAFHEVPVPPGSPGSSSGGRRTPSGWFGWNWWRRPEPPGSDDASEPEVERERRELDDSLGEPEDIEAPPPTPDHHEDLVVTRLRQHRPYFVACQVALLFLLWTVPAARGAAGGEGSFLTIVAGLDSVSPGATDLRLHALCEGCTNDDIPGPPAASCEDHTPQVWRWLTYQYTHAGLVHVATNCLVILLFGIPLEGLHGTVWLAVMFNVGVVGGALCYFIYDAHQAVVGASGGCYALIGIHVASLVMNWDEMRFRVPILVFIVALVAVELASYATSLTTDVSNASHIGGSVAGLIIGIVVGENLKIRRWELVIQVLSCCLGLGLAVCCVGWLLSSGSFRNLYEAEPWCWIAQVWHEGTQSYKCVKCGDQGCIDMWMLSAHIYETTLGNCRAVGFLEATR